MPPSQTREEELKYYHEISEPIDEATFAHHNSLIKPIRLLNADPNRDYAPLVQFIRRILVHLTVSSKYCTGTIGSYTMMLWIMRRTPKGKVAMQSLYPNSGDEVLSYVLPYIRETPPAIVLEDRTPPECSWGSWRNNEIVISRELVTTYLNLEKSKATLDSDDERCLVFLQTIILVTFLHELTHTLMNRIFMGRLGSFFECGDNVRDIGEHLERSLFTDSVLYVEWLRADFEDPNPKFQVKKIRSICSQPVETGEGFHSVLVEDLRTMLDSIDRSELFSPVFLLQDAKPSDIISADSEHIRLRITPEYSLPVLNQWAMPLPVTEIGPDSIIIEPACGR
ncbi:uncharacterized protein EV420DRAFT_385569 [Desarmillaria tabescens]|uniref:Uncharacterized protein n=1 Tax=Armillaria tabescens TaxID=1929756 RepID=A0AA39KE45_ARMTA|nr:uncharacterized protein EV420DRAFT_385569 [Desarmillaria tabescens]KAK0458216.1 hypothetical protein EV420DRAFT_385569 [Desarmillaria tabescens]